MCWLWVALAFVVGSIGGVLTMGVVVAGRDEAVANEIERLRKVEKAFMAGDLKGV
jgi:hypothetical protein